MPQTETSHAASATVQDTRDTRKTQMSELDHNRYVLSVLVGRDFKRKYRRSVLGVVWSVLNPLLMMIVLTAVFSYMFRFSIEHYPLYLILGQTLFAMMQNATTSGMQSILESSSMIKKIKIEKIVFPFEKVLFELVNFLFSIIAIVAVALFLQVWPSPQWLFLPLLLVYVVIFTTGLALILSALAVFFRDVIHLWSVICTAWMYATPILYPMDLLPDWLANLMAFNPMHQYVLYFRDIFMWQTAPSLTMNLVCLGMAVATFAVGFLVFRKTERKFILYV
ncbi:ABC transporter permease [Curtanaerobium respiraculi]|uniref:ABC transporter permease n=1 Tax=Curtanaerobium respiraculi TaxID=2949669 RepID=UPI0024B382A5|nr:ABC transporter permease [Curtanaerobium respiraculi]